jgi:DNA-binding transcriptional regulator GbsR (MarR family)
MKPSRADACRQIVILYIRFMPNMSNKENKAERRFVEDVARLLTPWGVPHVAARLYGHLLLCSRPVSLDQITEDLGISKSSASVAARLLESYRLAHRHSEPGTKRALYAVAEDYEAMIQQQNRLVDALAGQLTAGAEIAASKAVSDRLEEMADFYRVMRGAMEDAMTRWKRRRRRR